MSLRPSSARLAWLPYADRAQAERRLGGMRVAEMTGLEVVQTQTARHSRDGKPRVHAITKPITFCPSRTSGSSPMRSHCRPDHPLRQVPGVLISHPTSAGRAPHSSHEQTGCSQPSWRAGRPAGEELENVIR